MPSITVQRAPVAEMGYGKRAEHGLGAWLPIVRLPRVRPLTRFEAAKAANKVVPRKFYALGFSQGCFFF